VPYRDALGAPARTSHGPAAELVRALETESDFDRPLAVQIAALLHVAGTGAAEDGQGMAGLLAKFSGWNTSTGPKDAQAGGQPNWQAAIKHGVAQVTLASPAGSQVARRRKR
jgi:hypothetical protein